jgi:hypothetical protein
LLVVPSSAERPQGRDTGTGFAIRWLRAQSFSRWPPNPSKKCVASYLLWEKVLEANKKIVAVLVFNLKHVVPPPRLLSRNASLVDFLEQLVDCLPRQLQEETAPIIAIGIFTQDDLAAPAIDLAYGALTVCFVPLLLEPKFTDVELDRTLEI